jgi:peptidoglycan-associated lipoprotein
MRRVHFHLWAWLPALVCLAFATGCPPKYPNCSNDKDCHPGEYCVNGKCQQCRTDGDCPSGKCQSGRCAEGGTGPVSKVCTDDSQCPAGQSCIDGRCKPCVSDDQCGEGGKCNAGKCQRAGGPPVKASCQLEPIYFDFNESSLTTEATGAIDRDADCIKKTDHDVTLVGRTDPRGTEEYNLALSDRRAQAVKERLGRMGVNKNSTATARGEMDATGKDEAGWAKDRRVDVSW